MKLHSRLWTIPHLILTHNTQDFCSTNTYFVCVIVHDQMWCVCSIACQSNPKRFLSILYVFESVLCFCVLSFWSNYIFHVFFKNFFRGIFARSLWLSSSRENRLRQNLKTQNSDRDFCNYFVTKDFLQKVLCFKCIFRK